MILQKRELTNDNILWIWSLVTSAGKDAVPMQMVEQLFGYFKADVKMTVRLKKIDLICEANSYLIFAIEKKMALIE